MYRNTIIVQNVIPNLGHMFSIPHSQKIQSIDAHTSLDVWRAGKMCLAEKCQALTLLKSSKRSRGGCDFSVKRTTLFLERQYISDIKRLFNTTQNNWKLKTKTFHQEICHNYLTEWVSLSCKGKWWVPNSWRVLQMLQSSWKQGTWICVEVTQSNTMALSWQKTADQSVLHTPSPKYPGKLQVLITKLYAAVYYYLIFIMIMP